jgi:hypothetical protein
MNAYRDRRVPDWMCFIVLKRDRFSCVECGNSPSLDPACRIAAVRVAPFFRPGRPGLDGTWTLCMPCCRRITGRTPKPRAWEDPIVDGVVVRDEPRRSLLDRLKRWLRSRAA